MTEELQTLTVEEAAETSASGEIPPTRRHEMADLSEAVQTPWLTVKEAAARARCGSKLIYREVRAGRLRAARVGGRRELRFLDSWIDEWLVRCSTVQDVQ